jgi:hypothetical protein
MDKPILAALMTVVVVLAATLTVNADPVSMEGSRTVIVGWGYSYQEASADAYAQVRDKEVELGKWFDVDHFEEGEIELHDPPCFVKLFGTFREPKQ